jgi:hypothetical protein
MLSLLHLYNVDWAYKLGYNLDHFSFNIVNVLPKNSERVNNKNVKRWQSRIKDV